jgi:putative ABC transport system ATP-binding protein
VTGAIIDASEVRKEFPPHESAGKSGPALGHDQEALQILRGVSLRVEKLETVAIMGRSGCGKSTFISLLAGLDAPTSGRIEVLGRELSELSTTELNLFRARHIGIVFQTFHLLDHLTALENVRLPIDLNVRSQKASERSADERAKEMLEKVGLVHRLHHFPDQLSRGECQRVAIARVLVMKPEVLLADEPTGSLDTKTGREVIDLIFKLAQDEKLGLVMATHDLKVAERCQRLLYMDDGRLSTERPLSFA